MTGIIVVFPRLEDARGIRNLLVRSGFSVHAVCTTGAQAISSLEDLNDGIVISGYKLTDMMYPELKECLPEGFTLLLLATRQHLSEYYGMGDNIACLAMPLKAHELVETVHRLIRQCGRNRKKRRENPRVKSPEEMELIARAKEALMAKKSMTEMQAHKYLQKCSMDSGRSIAESARMVLML
ncbi:MAG: ANTAR domain-containing protein [Lachnospiraceae bacterium]|jgi:DNA-binding NtrC family response regulator|nr:ANTAR domain-containing protein [Lachnospiraceae bacterium]